MTTKLFERLVTKFSIKVTDLIKYLEISKATIYNYRNLETFRISLKISNIKSSIFREGKRRRIGVGSRRFDKYRKFTKGE